MAASRRLGLITVALACVVSACTNAPGSAASGGPAASFGTVSWTSVGPAHLAKGASGKLNAFAIDPANREIMYTAGGSGTGREVHTQAGIYGTTDGGTTWRTLDVGLVDAHGFIVGNVNDLSLDPSAPQVLVAATANGIYQSTNAGARWKLTGSSGQPATQFARLGHAIYAATKNGVLVSDDDGATWTTSLPDPPGVKRATTLAVAGHVVYAGFGGQAPVYARAGGRWTPGGTAPASVHRLAADPFNPSLVYASINNGKYDQNLYGSTDGGKSWRKVSYPKVLGAQTIGFSTVFRHRLYLGGDGHPLYYTAADGSAAPHWTSAYSGPVDKRQIFLAPNAARTDDQCWVTADQGLMWTDSCSHNTGTSKHLSAGIANFLVKDFAVNSTGRGIATALQDYNGMSSADGGRTWQPGPTSEDGAAAVNPGNPGLCYLYRNFFARSSTGCGGFQRTGSGLTAPTTDSGVIAFDPASPKTMYVLDAKQPKKGKAPAARRPGVYVSHDAGATFTPTSWGFTDPVSIAIDPANPAHILVAGGHGTIHMSTDGGATWHSTSGPSMTHGIAFALHHPDTVLLAGIGAIWRSDDKGDSFRRTWKAHTRMRQIACNPRGGTDPVCVAATGDGLFASRDLGASWARIDQHTITHNFTSVRWQDGYLYAGTYGQGIIRTNRPLT